MADIYTDNHGSYDSRRFGKGSVYDSRIVRNMLLNQLDNRFKAMVARIKTVDDADDVLRGMEVLGDENLLELLRSKTNFEHSKHKQRV